MGKRPSLSSLVNFSLLQTYVRIVDTGNISAAARSLYLTQSAVSMQLAALTRKTGLPLLERTHGRWEPTAAGTTLYKRAKELLVLVDQLERELADASKGVAGHIVLGSTRTITDTLLGPLVAEFTTLFPDIRLTVLAGNRREAELRIAAGEVDVALVALPFGDANVETCPFDEDELIVLVPADHRLAHAGSVPFDQIASEPFVLFEEGSGVRALVEEALTGRYPALDVRLSLPSNDGLVACVESGIGLAFIPLRSAMRWSRVAAVSALRITDVDLKRSLAVALHRGRAPNASVAAFERWIRERHGVADATAEPSQP